MPDPVSINSRGSGVSAATGSQFIAAGTPLPQGHNLRTIFLTGASSGIGLETARLLTARGFEVWGTSRDSSRLPQLPRFHPVQMDLARTNSIRTGFAAALNEAGAFAVLINNAGAGAFGPLEAMPADLVREQFQVLVDAPLELTRLALPPMRARNLGLIINITSLAALFPVPFMAPYNAAKAALSSFTQELRTELSNTPIRVVEVRPGDINTPFHRATKKVESTPGSEDQRRAHAAWETELRNMAAAPPPERVARVIARLIDNPHPPPVVIVGGFFQARLAPWGIRLLPHRLLEWGLRRHYGI
jgi:NAD(P)-dependent dehydrogenase (short-subunit alcohol dehydrogenase family)